MNPLRPGAFLTLHYRLADLQGRDVVNTFGGKPATLTLGSGQLAPAIEARLMQLPVLREGERVGIQLEPGEAFGERNPELLQRVSRSLLDELGEARDTEYRVGDVVQFPTPGGEASYAGVVREVGDGWMLFDFNHPLAGHAVQFDMQLIGVL